MPRSTPLLLKRNDKILDRYKELENKKFGEVKLYRHTAILEMLSKEFYLQPSTIELVLIKHEHTEKKQNNEPKQPQE